MIGTTVSHYRVLAKLGAGGMGVVYEAQDLRLPRRVALKFLHPGLLDDPVALVRFKREAGALSLINHPNICTIYEVDEFDGQPFIAMERLEGETLRARLNRAPLEDDELLRITTEVTEALHAAHQKGIIHRDIKPGNVVLTPTGVKVLDFGLAKALETWELLTGDEATIEGRPVGTISYMSPEQISQEPLDHRSDLFSVGVLMFEMATGSVPFKGGSPGETVDKILNDDPPSLADRSSRRSAGLEPIVRRLLAKSPEGRYQSAPALLDDLNAFSRSVDPAAPHGSSLWLRTLGLIPPRRRWAYAAAGAVVIILASAYWSSYGAAEARFAARDRLLVGGIDNLTGDAQLNALVSESIVSELYQSPYVSVVSDDTVRDVLTRMRLSPETPVTEHIAREIAVREGVTAVLLGSVGPVGRQYAVRVRVVRPATESVLASAVEVAPTVEQTIPAAHAAARALRQQLGETLASIDTHTVPLAPVTTDSLEALRLFTLAKQELQKSRAQEALVLLNRAIDLDPGFAMAFHYAAIACARMGDFPRLMAYERDAVRLANRFGPRERRTIEADYYHVVDQYDKAIGNYRLLINEYPDDDRNYSNLGRIYWKNLQPAESIKMFERALQLRPNPGTLTELAQQYFKMGDFANMLRVVRQSMNGDARQRFFALLDLATYELAQQHDDQVERALQEAEGWAPGDAARTHWWALASADSLLAHGRPIAALQALGGVRVGFESGPAIESAWRRAHRYARVLLLLGNRRQVRGVIRDLPDMPWRPQLWVLKGLLAARAGDLATAEAIRASLQKDADLNAGGPLRYAVAKQLEAEIEIERGRRQYAVDLAREAFNLYGSTLTLETLARTQRRAGDLAAAADSYRRLLTREYERAMDQDGPAMFEAVLARYELARILDELGRKNEAKVLFQDFLNRWRNAETSLPFLEIARRGAGVGAQVSPAGRVPAPAT